MKEAKPAAGARAEKYSRHPGQTFRRLTVAFLFLLALLAGGGGFPARSAAAVQEQPTVARDSVQVNAFTFNVYKGNYDV